MKKATIFASIVCASLICSCAALNFLGERLNMFLVNFSFGGIGVSLVTPPNLISLKLSDYGIAINCRVNAKNDNTSRAVFDGADFLLRVNDTAKSAQGISAPVPSFAVEAGQTQAFTVPFKIMLNSSMLTRGVLQKVVYGDRIPYRVSANLKFNLAGADTGGLRGLSLLGEKTVAVDLVSDAVDTRPDLSSFAGKAFMTALNLVSGR
jgi:hypothetical protein